LSEDIYLSVAPNRVTNGGFEVGLAAWSAGGDQPPRQSSESLSGVGAAELTYSGDSGTGDVAAISSVAQSVDVPSGSATLSLEYRLDTPPVCDSEGCDYVDKLEVLVVETDSPGGRVSHLTGRDGIRSPTEGWEHVWFDMSPWSGKQVRLELAFQMSLRADPGTAWLDNIAIGATDVSPGSEAAAD
jgi:hypothetical protein